MGRLRGSFEYGVFGGAEEEDAFHQVSTDAFEVERYLTFCTCRVGPVSSLHDRACELFFTIKGGSGG